MTLDVSEFPSASGRKAGRSRNATSSSSTSSLSVDRFTNLQFLPWYHRPLPIAEWPWLTVLRLFTMHTVGFTFATTVVAIATVQILLAVGYAHSFGGYAYTFVFTVITFIIGIYVNNRVILVERIAAAVNTLQQHMSEVMSHDIYDRGKMLRARDLVVSAATQLSAETGFVPVDSILPMLFGENSKHIDLASKDLVRTTMNTLMAARPSYIYMYIETLIHMYNALATFVLYPILIRERLGDSWTWIPISAVVCFISYAMVGMLYINSYEMEAWGVIPVPARGLARAKNA